MPSFAGLLTRQARCRQQPFCERQQSPPLRFRRFNIRAYSRSLRVTQRRLAHVHPARTVPGRHARCRRPPATRSFPNATTLPPKALRCMTRKPAPGANPISHRRNRCRSSRSMPSTTTRMARGQSRSVMMAPRSPARRRTVSSKRRACVLSMFSHIAGNEAKHKSVFHGTEPGTPNCWTSVSGMQSETAIWHASSRLWSTIPLSNAFANGASKSRTARPLPTMPRSIQAVATLPTMPLPKNASPVPPHWRQ